MSDISAPPLLRSIVLGQYVAFALLLEFVGLLVFTEISLFKPGLAFPAMMWFALARCKKKLGYTYFQNHHEKKVQKIIYASLGVFFIIMAVGIALFASLVLLVSLAELGFPVASGKWFIAVALSVGALAMQWMMFIYIVSWGILKYARNYKLVNKTAE